MAMKRLQVSLLALLACAPNAGIAQDIILDEIVVTANRTETEAGRTGVSVAVVTEDDLKRLRQVSVAETLSRLPGVSLSQQGPFGNSTNLRVRGADGRYLAVFIDGIKVSDPSATQTSFDFGTLMTADISRIEVLRGSQSALWGGSAVGGVINITTRGATEEGTRQTIEAEAGSFGTARLSYGYAMKSATTEMGVNLTHLHSDGFSAIAGTAEADGVDATRLSFNLRHALTDTVTLGASLFRQVAQQEYDGSNSFTYALEDQDNLQTRTETGARVFAEIAAGNTDHVVDLSWFDIGRKLDEQGDLPTDPRNVSRFGGDRLALGWKATTTLSDQVSFVYGADATQERADYDNLPDGSADTVITGAFGQALWAPRDDLDLSATLRADHNSTFGTFPTGRLAANWRPADGTTLRAAVATGFRAPSIDERFGDYSIQEFQGNPDLSPEESLSFEIGVEQDFTGGATLSVTAFRLEIDNLVTYAPCPYIDPDNFNFFCQPGTVSTLENIAGTSIRQGVEVAGALPLSDTMTLGLAYTYTDARTATGGRIGFVPRHDLGLTLDAALSDRLSGAVTLKSASDRYDSFYGVTLDAYTVVNAEARYDLTDTAQAYLRVENVLDTDYELVSGYANSGRAVYVGFAASF
jgi:vitamin B12 transporter